MNIFIPHSWLLDHLQTTATPEEIQKSLSLSGPSVERIIHQDGEAIYDIEITTNRVDSFSVRGLAREAAVILNQFNFLSSLKQLPTAPANYPVSSLPVPKIINNPQLCRRVICAVIEGVQRTPTPDWMSKRLKQIELNVHDSAIDITNYITHDLGHPCHAFDYDKLMATGGEIQIVEAQKGEKFTTLDGAEFTSVGGEVVFKNAQGLIIDLPSIKGTHNTAIDENTTNILLLLESIKPDKVRFASMTHAIRTTAAQILEKGVDPALAEVVIVQALRLYQEICQPKAIGQIADEFPQLAQPTTINFPLAKAKQYLGVEIEPMQIKQILTQLECQVDTQAEDTLLVTPPTFRPDLETPVDLVEEIARIYGYHRLPATIMAGQLPLNAPTDQHFDREKTLKLLLVHLGIQELYTYSMVSAGLAESSPYSLDQHLKLLNPLSEDKVYLRRSLLPSLGEALVQNPDHPELEFFEIAHIYHPEKDQLPDQQLVLAIASRQSYRRLRGILESIFASLFVDRFSFKALDKSGAEIVLIGQDGGEKSIGWIGHDPANENIVQSELQLAPLFQLAKKYPNYQPIPKTSPIIEDLTFQTPPTVQIGELIETIKQHHNLISNVTLKDIYQRNVTLTITYWDKQHNLSNLDVRPIRLSIVNHVKSKQLGELIGKLPD